MVIKNSKFSVIKILVFVDEKYARSKVGLWDAKLTIQGSRFLHHMSLKASCVRMDAV
jgi:hypothetical protein